MTVPPRPFGALEESPTVPAADRERPRAPGSADLPIALTQPVAYNEDEKEERLRVMKRRATGLLVASTVIFVVVSVLEKRFPWLGIVRATFEAAMVGGLADWFAVTALFRHPMGIPIPHTAIIPSRKDRVGQTLGAFVQRNFLNRDVIAFKLRQLDAARRIAQWIAQPENARRIAKHAASSFAAAASVARDEDVQAFLDRTLANRVRATKVAPLVGKALTLVTAGNRHQELLNAAIALIAKGVHENQDLIRRKIEEETPWWIPGFADEKIHQKIVAGIDRTLAQVRDDPHHPLRARFDDALHDFILKLHHSPEVMAKAEALKEELLDAEVVRRFSASVWEDTKAAIFRYAERAEEQPPGSIERAMTAFGEAVLSDPDLLAKLDRWLTDAVLYVVERYQDEVGELIAQTVKAWDPNATSRRIELAIGRDLQFIRINGTIVGGLVGAVLWSLAKLL